MSLPPQSSGVDLYAAGQLNRMANAQSAQAAALRAQADATSRQNQLLAEQNRLQQRREQLEIERRNQVNLLHDISTFQTRIQQISNLGILDFLMYTDNMNKIFGKSDFSMLERIEELELKKDILNSYYQNYNLVKSRLQPEALRIYEQLCVSIKSIEEKYQSINSQIIGNNNTKSSLHPGFLSLESEYKAKSSELEESKKNLKKLKKVESHKVAWILFSLPLLAVAALTFGLGVTKSPPLIFLSFPIIIAAFIVATYPLTATKKIPKIKERKNGIKLELADLEKRFNPVKKQISDLHFVLISLEEQKAMLQEEYNKMVQSYKLQLGIPENFNLEYFNFSSTGNYVVGGYPV